ncbi:putative phylloplanin [Helianthus annuus]|nr:putative phylloplanin [Helianthus annuus]
MAMKSIFSITILAVVLVATQAQALGIIPNVNIGTLVNINGTVSCSVNASVSGTTPAPPFPNATVALSCGGRVIATTMTNNMGMLNIMVMLNQFLPITLSNITSSCRLVVVTPLSTCNATLPSNGTLEAPLRFVNSTVISTTSGLRNSLNFLAPNFTLRVQA